MFCYFCECLLDILTQCVAAMLVLSPVLHEVINIILLMCAGKTVGIGKVLKVIA